MKKIFLKALAIAIMASGLQINQAIATSSTTKLSPGDKGAISGATVGGVIIGIVIALFLKQRALSTTRKTFIAAVNKEIKDKILKQKDFSVNESINTEEIGTIVREVIDANKAEFDSVLSLPEDLRVAGWNKLIDQLSRGIKSKLDQGDNVNLLALYNTPIASTPVPQESRGLIGIGVTDPVIMALKVDILNAIKPQAIELELSESDLTKLTDRLHVPETAIDIAKVEGYNNAKANTMLGQPKESDVLKEQILSLRAEGMESPGILQSVNSVIRDLNAKHKKITGEFYSNIPEHLPIGIVQSPEPLRPVEY